MADRRVIITASELHKATGKSLKRVAIDKEHLVVERDGYPVAVMLPYTEYEKYEQMLLGHTPENEHSVREEMSKV